MTASPHPAFDHQRAPDWEAFYKSFKKPGFVHGYEIVNKLGGGVFGVVYKARKESIGKAYAIKFLKVEDPSVRKEVLGELDGVSLFAQVDHPNLVSIEDKGVVEGIPYIVMGYAGDETLKSRIEGGGLSEQDALSLFVQVARGVQALHDHSLVHFDLKPANVFLKGDVARVGDYGLSKLITETAMSLTTGRGTPYYMAPEMLRRRGDHRSDIYSLGVILYECLTGGVPFTGDSEWEVLKGHEERSVEFPASVTPFHRALIERMLTKDPDGRIASVAEVLAALRSPEDLAVAPAGNWASKPAAPVTGHDQESWWPWVGILFAAWVVIRRPRPSGLLLLGAIAAVAWALWAFASRRKRAPPQSQRSASRTLWGWIAAGVVLLFLFGSLLAFGGLRSEGPEPTDRAREPIRPVDIHRGR